MARPHKISQRQQDRIEQPAIPSPLIFQKVNISSHTSLLLEEGSKGAFIQARNLVQA
jgi:hypothetical protein